MSWFDLFMWFMAAFCGICFVVTIAGWIDLEIMMRRARGRSPYDFENPEVTAWVKQMQSKAPEESA